MTPFALILKFLLKFSPTFDIKLISSVKRVDAHFEQLKANLRRRDHKKSSINISSSSNVIGSRLVSRD